MVYSALAAAEPVALPGLPVQFADFSEWQRQSLQGEYLDRLIRLCWQ